MCHISSINKSNSIEVIDKRNLTNQAKLRLDEISKIENYLIEESNWRKPCSKKLIKYITVFDYIDQALIVFSATSGGALIISFTSIVGTPVGIASVGLTLFFPLTTGIVKKLMSMIKFLCWLNVNAIALKL